MQTSQGRRFATLFPRPRRRRCVSAPPTPAGTVERMVSPNGQSGSERAKAPPDRGSPMIMPTAGLRTPRNRRKETGMGLYAHGISPRPLAMRTAPTTRPPGIGHHLDPSGLLPETSSQTKPCPLPGDPPLMGNGIENVDWRPKPRCPSLAAARPRTRRGIGKPGRREVLRTLLPTGR